MWSNVSLKSLYESNIAKKNLAQKTYFHENLQLLCFHSTSVHECHNLIKDIFVNVHVYLGTPQNNNILGKALGLMQLKRISNSLLHRKQQ